MLYRSIHAKDHPTHPSYSHVSRAVPDGTGGWQKQGPVLGPDQPYEIGGRWNAAGCEDPRVQYIEELGLSVLVYCAGTYNGPRVAVAVSWDEGVTWRKLGLISFPDQPDLDTWDNKNALFLPRSVRSPSGRRCLALVHRPKPSMIRMPGFRGGIDDVDDAMSIAPRDRPSMYIGYVPLQDAMARVRALTSILEAQPLFTPADIPWEPDAQVGVGAGSQFLEVPGHGFLTAYHGVYCRDYKKGVLMPGTGRYDLFHWGGLMVLDPEEPHKVLQAGGPCMFPETPEELGDPNAPDAHLFSTKVVFPTHIEWQTPSQILIWYGAGDQAVATALLTMQEPTITAAWSPAQP
jgi:predicted GH43/DUF377 family glycosyl hydrolase